MSKPVDAVLIGAGQRGADSYAPFALQHPERLRFVAVAEPIAARRERFAAQHQIPRDRQFSSWEELLALPQLGEAALVCTQDHQHTAPALAAMRAGYHVLLEKPMATTPEECRQLVAASQETRRQLHICHVLRYTRHFQKMREIITSGRLGQVIDVAHRENVAFWHMAHSYVRGNWRNREQSSPMILAKCCHDLDILLWLLEDAPTTDTATTNAGCLHLSSTGALTHFRAENAPAGAPQRCLDGCPAQATCPYYAPWFYQEMAPFWRSFASTAKGFSGWAASTYLRHPQWMRAAARIAPPLRQMTDYRGWPLTVLAEDPTPENINHALREGPYGRCVYHCDNNVVDHQVVSMQFAGDISVTLTMHGHSNIEYRTTRIEGTRGRLLAEFGNGGSFIEIDEHRSGAHTRMDTSPADPMGHGGGDPALVSAFLDSIRGTDTSTQYAWTTAQQSLASHLMAFAAEQARLEGIVIGAEAFR
jgi:predicted dehydrogenase